MCAVAVVDGCGMLTAFVGTLIATVRTYAVGIGVFTLAYPVTIFILDKQRA